MEAVIHLLFVREIRLCAPTGLHPHGEPSFHRETGILRGSAASPTSTRLLYVSVGFPTPLGVPYGVDRWVGGISSAPYGPDSRASSQPFGQGIGTVTSVRLGLGLSGFWERWAEPVTRRTPPPHQAGLLPGPSPSRQSALASGGTWRMAAYFWGLLRA